eukprot:CAMPEP_0198258034 /NCGR_PEP_ID=MMETSP1447-20131203/7557_1 /TAXON_ID=420782 /ORGANISM="Chaetoceros dichaeta, Strain CCMP1751" /LENGTH=329 /DNA_ID=CAMNT_0043945067 /DNA_START=193 /DNA_END=1182 /DNA_ORIENTATION=-
MLKALSFTAKHSYSGIAFTNVKACTIPAAERILSVRNLVTTAYNTVDDNDSKRYHHHHHHHPWKLHQTSLSSVRSSSSSSSSGSDILASFSAQSRNQFEGQNIAGAMEALARADAVCFDVDSTVITEEGIDVLAASLGKGAEVSAWTLKAMEGNTKFEDALAARLAIMKPSRASVDRCLSDHPLQFSPGVETLIESLRLADIDVWLVSGGFRSMIEPIAKQLCIDKANIIANTILYDADGTYAGFDREELTSADMGKPKAVQAVKEKYGYETVIMVGDGATDAQAKPPADAFIGFGGVSVRESVREKACWYVKDFEAMNDVVSKFGKST